MELDSARLRLRLSISTFVFLLLLFGDWKLDASLLARLGSAYCACICRFSYSCLKGGNTLRRRRDLFMLERGGIGMGRLDVRVCVCWKRICNIVGR